MFYLVRYGAVRCIHLVTPPYSCASVNNNKKCAIGRSENERNSVLWGKMFIFVVAYMNMINDVGNLT